MGDVQGTPLLMTSAQVCATLAVCRQTLTNWWKDGYLVPLKLGRAVRYRATDVAAIANGSTRVFSRK